MTAGKGGEELYKQKQALNISYAIDSYHSSLSKTSKKVVVPAVLLILLPPDRVLVSLYSIDISLILIL
jgi:hypothetical protein